MSDVSASPLVRCPPYCRSNCVTKHHPLLVALLNCGDTEEKSLMQQRIEDLQHVVTKYEREKKWKIDQPIPEMVENYRYPLVHWACAMGRVAALIWLLGHGAQAKQIEPSERATGLHRALECLQETCPKDAAAKFRQMLPVMQECLLLANQEGNTPLHVACEMLVSQMPRQDFYQQCVSSILEHEKRCRRVQQRVLMMRNSKGNTALHLLSQHDSQVGLVREILSLGLDLLEVKNLQEETPLDVALGHGQMFMSRLLNQTVAEQADITKSPKKEKSTDWTPGTPDKKQRGRARRVQPHTCNSKSDSGRSTPMSDQGSEAGDSEDTSAINQTSTQRVTSPKSSASPSGIEATCSYTANGTSEKRCVSENGPTPVIFSSRPPTDNNPETPSRIIVVSNPGLMKDIHSPSVSLKKYCREQSPSLTSSASKDSNCGTSPRSHSVISASPDSSKETLRVKWDSRKRKATSAKQDIEEKMIKTEADSEETASPQSSSEVKNKMDCRVVGSTMSSTSCVVVTAPSDSTSSAATTTTAAPSSMGQQEGASFIKYLKVCDPVIREKMYKSIQQDKTKCDSKLAEITRSQREIDSRLEELAKKQKDAAGAIKQLLETLSSLQSEEETLKQDMSRLRGLRGTTMQSLNAMRERIQHCQAALSVLRSLA